MNNETLILGNIPSRRKYINIFISVVDYTFYILKLYFSITMNETLKLETFHQEEYNRNNLAKQYLISTT